MAGRLPLRKQCVFQFGRSDNMRFEGLGTSQALVGHLDESPWVLPSSCEWKPEIDRNQNSASSKDSSLSVSMTETTPGFRVLTETFPGNLAAFVQEAVTQNRSGISLTLERIQTRGRLYSSGSFASVSSFLYDRFEAEIKVAAGPGLITGFFLHRHSPRQEIDIEFTGDDPTTMLTNVYFNPGDAGTALAFGYRGSPCRIKLGFDASLDFHSYAIEWSPEGINWSVDGRVVHTREGWDPTPVPHLSMTLLGNIWAPKSKELAGTIADACLPATSRFRNIKIWT